jgi:hypothetical protein
MTDVILIAAIVAFFVAGALLVRVLDGMIAHAGHDADSDDDALGPVDDVGRPRSGSAA